MIEYYLWLNDALYLNYQNNKEIIKRFESPKEIYKNRKKLADDELFKRLSKSVFLDSDIAVYREEYFNAEKMGVSIISIDDENYPQYLREHDDAPILFYAKGDIKLLCEGRRISIIGSRRLSQYGRRATTDITTAICDCGITTVSGLALGADSVVQSIAVSKGKKSICIMPNGFKVNYPADNKVLRDEICKSGLVISEFSLNRPAERYNFRARNRLFSILSDAVIVTEASKSSGSVLSGSIAAKYGVDVFCVPYPLYDESGCNDLIADGAYIIPDISSLLAMLSATQLKECDSLLLDNDMQLILKSLKGEMKTLDEIIEQTALSPSDVLIMISTLEMSGIIKSSDDKYYI